LRLSDLERLGGSPSVGQRVAEGYVLGQKFFARGFKVALSSYVVEA